MIVKVSWVEACEVRDSRLSRFHVLCPEGAVQRAVLDCFGDMLGLDCFYSFQIGNCSCNFEDAIVGASGEALLGHGAF